MKGSTTNGIAWEADVCGVMTVTVDGTEGHTWVLDTVKECAEDVM